MGFQESLDCMSILEVLRKEHGYSRFVLWGRSMGAVAAIICLAEKKPADVEYLVLDSPFSDIRQLVKDISNNQAGSLGEYVGEYLFEIVNREITLRIGHDLSVFKPIDYC